jgi:hypothetical protein
MASRLRHGPIAAVAIQLENEEQGEPCGTEEDGGRRTGSRSGRLQCSIQDVGEQHRAEYGREVQQFF